MSLMNAQIWIAIAVGVAAMVDDLARRHIANWIPVAALAGGIGWQVGRDGAHGLLTALGGAALGFGAFLVFYLLGGMGGGDVKLMAGFGALLGASHILEAALWAAGIGGVLALGAIGWQSVAPAAARISGKAGVRLTPQEKERNATIPYAPAITFGVWLALIPKT
jgi:prepilin peptidase CpaA